MRSGTWSFVKIDVGKIPFDVIFMLNCSVGCLLGVTSVIQKRVL